MATKYRGWICHYCCWITIFASGYWTDGNKMPSLRGTLSWIYICLTSLYFSNELKQSKERKKNTATSSATLSRQQRPKALLQLPSLPRHAAASGRNGFQKERNLKLAVIIFSDKEIGVFVFLELFFSFKEILMIFDNVLKGHSRNMHTHTCASCMRFTWRYFLLPGVVQQCLLESQPCGKHPTVEKNHAREEKSKTVICIQWKCSGGKNMKRQTRGDRQYVRLYAPLSRWREVALQ